MASFLLFVQRVSQAYRPVSSLAMDRMYSKFVLLFLAVTFCDSSAQKVNVYEPHVKVTSYYPRSCYHAKKSNDPAMKDSGMYWIDPDGLGIGDGPIYVYCDMKTGLTSVLHDAEDEIPVPVCADKEGCYKKVINYPNATARQMRALAQVSENCQQSIEVNCLRGPLQGPGQNGVPKDFTWWLDRKGNPQYFWAGDGNSGHTCQCGIERTCLLESLNCNCDANVAIPLTDSGVIVSKELLPITGLSFSNTAYEGGSHKVGRFNCSGLQKIETDVKGVPKSCKDLWLLGQTVNGMYITSKKKDTTAFLYFFALNCNFQDNDEEIVSETLIGNWPANEE